MRIDIITCLPKMFDGFINQSILHRATEKGIVEFQVHDLRNYTQSRYKQIDDYSYGGGAGMVMMIEPIAACIRNLKAQRDYSEVIYMSPDGQTFNQSMANRLSIGGNIIILCGHYKGVDERVRELFITREISIGDYVLTGGELAAAVVADAVVRLIPGVMNDETSALTDSFQDGLLAGPVYTRPENFEGHKVPEVLLTGNHKAIETWRFEKQIERTKSRRPDLFNKFSGQTN